MATKCIDQEVADKYAVYCGDCCEVTESIPNNSIGLSVFSPPFADLYCYSNNERDMGNCKNYDQFFVQFGVLADQLFRVMMEGRSVTIHCMDIPAMKERDGYIGIKDFPGDIIRCFQKRGFIYHGRCTIWKDPLIEATRTKALGLMHKQLCKDSALCRMGLPDYIVVLRKPGENKNPIIHPQGLSSYAGRAVLPPGNQSHNIWRAYASPIWTDIRQTRTLNRKEAREEKDEKHICPLQLDVIERCLTLYSNPGDTLLTPFMGVGSEVCGAIQYGRRAIGIELKESYYRQAIRNIHHVVEIPITGEGDLFSAACEKEEPEEEYNEV